MNGWVGKEKKNIWEFFCLLLAEKQTKQPDTDHHILHLLLAYICLDACHALWSELWSEINIQSHIWRIVSSSSAHGSRAYCSV